VIIYAESSAVIAWLLNEPGCELVRTSLKDAELIVTSRLTVVECSRVLHRARLAERLSDEGALAAQRLLDETSDTWVIMDMVGDVATRAARPFPKEPLRTLDALHVASAAVFHDALGALSVLSLDERVRGNVTALGIGVVPAKAVGR
jgi:predicted nucleic acid-binding protein